MASLRALTRSRLIALVEATILSYGDDNCTVQGVAQKALAEAREICVDDYDAAITGWIKPIARRLMRKTTGPAGVPTLLPGMVLPYRIAVPALHGMEDYEAPEGEDDEDERGDTGIAWIVLHKASIAEGRRNVGMRMDLIKRSLAEHDKIKLVVDEAASKTEDENAIIGEILGLKK